MSRPVGRYRGFLPPLTPREVRESRGIRVGLSNPQKNPRKLPRVPDADNSAVPSRKPAVRLGPRAEPIFLYSEPQFTIRLL